jgi:Tfp pilus assembly protein PilO
MRLRELWTRVQRWYAAHSARDRRIISGVAAAVVVSMVYVAVVEPLRDYRRALAEEIEEGHEQLERAARFVAAADAITAERDDLQKRLEQARQRLLPGGSGTLGAAALQERANALAAEKGITVQSTQVMREEATDPFRKVTVRLMLSGELKPFAEFVSGLEYGPQQLTLPFVEVSRRGAAAGAKGPRTLTATVEVSGYIAAGEAAKAAEGEAPEGEAQAAAVEGEGAPAEGQAGPAAPAPEQAGQPPPPVAGQGQPPAPAETPPAAPPTTTVPAATATTMTPPPPTPAPVPAGQGAG